MAATPKVYLITGANRGIGLGLVNEIVSKQSDVVVFATARDPLKAKELNELSEKYPGKVEVVQYLAVGDAGRNSSLIELIKNKYGYIDTVIANAGLGSYIGPAVETPAEVFLNVVGVLVLFQATISLLRASTKTPKFIPISSGGGSITAFIDLEAGFTCYGASKAALNYVARKIHFEHKWLTCFPLAPGIVDSDMARNHRIWDKTGSIAPLQDALTTPADQAASLLVDIIDSSTREKEGGEFVNVDGSKIPW